jgi:hypothetical protein
MYYCALKAIAPMSAPIQKTLALLLLASFLRCALGMGGVAALLTADGPSAARQEAVVEALADYDLLLGLLAGGQEGKKEQEEQGEEKNKEKEEAERKEEAEGRRRCCLEHFPGTLGHAALPQIRLFQHDEAVAFRQLRQGSVSCQAPANQKRYLRFHSIKVPAPANAA